MSDCRAHLGKCPKPLQEKRGERFWHLSGPTLDHCEEDFVLCVVMAEEERVSVLGFATLGTLVQGRLGTCS